MYKAMDAGDNVLATSCTQGLRKRGAKQRVAAHDDSGLAVCQSEQTLTRKVALADAVRQ